VLAHRQQPLLDEIGDGRFARARQAGEPQASRLLVLDARTCGLVDIHVLPMDVAGAAQCEVERPRSDGRIALPIDQDEGAELPVVGVRLERHRLVQVDVAVRDFIEFEMLGRQVLLRVDIDLVLDFGDRRADRARADLQPVRSPGQQRVFAEPQQVHRVLVRDLRRLPFRR
jgi:hypothetical protein